MGLNAHIESLEVNWINTETLKLFFNQLIMANPDVKKIHLFLDNAGYHKSKEIQNFINDMKITLHLPPNLNPIERLWKIMHGAPSKAHKC